MADANAIVYSEVKFTKAKKNTEALPSAAQFAVAETACSSTEATYAEVKISQTRPSTEVHGSQQQVASNGRSKVVLKRVALAVLSALLVAMLIVLGLTYYKLRLTDENDAISKNDTDHKNSLTDENDAVKNLPETRCEVKICETCPQPCKPNTYERYLKCDEGWERNGTQCYYFTTKNLTWSESRADCRQRGGELVKIDSREEQTFLQLKLSDKMIYPEDKYWIGLTDSQTEGTWLWTDGSPLNKSLTFWRKDYEPDNWTGEDPDGEDCVRMGEKGGTDLDWWFDKSCKVPHKSICEKCAKCDN